MGQRKDDLYNTLTSYIDELHEKNKKRVRVSAISLIALPVVLGMVRWLTDSDKTAFLIIWVICMFLLAAYLVSVEYMDRVVYRKFRDLTGDTDDPMDLLEGEIFIPTKVRERFRASLSSEPAEDAEDAEDAEEGGRE